MKTFKELVSVLSFKGVIMVIFGSFLTAIAINMFYSSSGLYTLGFTGLAMIVASLLEGSSFDLGISFWLIIFNIPVMYIAIKHLGKRFTVYTILAILTSSFFIETVPKTFHLDDILLNALTGGLIYGVAITSVLKAGGSTGGTDILSLYYSFKKDVSIGQLALLMNGAVALLAGALNNVEIALYTVMASFVTSTLIDKFHTRYKKLRVEIVTDQADDLAQAILSKVHRGMTRMQVTGGYSKVHKEMLIIIITSYELVNVKDAIMYVDPGAFVSISDCKGIIGNFFNNRDL